MLGPRLELMELELMVLPLHPTLLRIAETLKAGAIGMHLLPPGPRRARPWGEQMLPTWVISQEPG